MNVCKGKMVWLLLKRFPSPASFAGQRFTHLATRANTHLYLREIIVIITLTWIGGTPEVTNTHRGKNDNS